MSQNLSPRVILIICEGESDLTALNVLKYFTKKLSVDAECKPIIQIIKTKGDKTTKQTFINGVPQNYLYQDCIDLISDSIRDRLTKMCLGKKVYLDDIDRVFFITDMDGVYISQDDIREADHYLDNDPYYGIDAIYTEGKVGRIASRNWRKRENLNYFLADNRYITLRVGGKEKTVPFNLFYMSCNLDHVLSEEANMPKYDKDNNACGWYTSVTESGSNKEIKEFFYSVYPDTEYGYQQSWHYITKPHSSRSLERGSNCSLILDYIEYVTRRKKQ